MEEIKLYLAYSCDSHPAWMEERLGHNGKYVGKTFLADYCLRFRGSPGSATLEDAEGSLVPCVLWRINAEAVTALAFQKRPGKPLNTPGAETVAMMRAAYKLQDIPEKLLDQAVQSSSV